MSLGDSARELAATLVAMSRQRLELAALDVEEELLRAGCAVAAMLAVTAFATLAAAAISAAIVVAMWDRAPVAALLAIGVVHAAAAAVLSLRLARALRTKPPFLAATLDELGKSAPAAHAQEQRA